MRCHTNNFSLLHVLKFLSAVLCCAIFLTACAANQPTATDPPESRNADSGLNETAKEAPEASGSETSALTSDSAESGFVSSYGLIYDEVEPKENGLLVAPAGGYEERMDAARLEELIGADSLSVLDAVLFPLSRSMETPTVAYYENGSVCWGAEMSYTEAGDPSKSVFIAFNPDHQVVCGSYYVGVNMAVDYSYDAFASVFLNVPDQNWIGETAVLLGHTEKYLGVNDAGETEKADVFLASFTCYGTNYIVESAALDETDFLRIVYAILES